MALIDVSPNWYVALAPLAGWPERGRRARPLRQAPGVGGKIPRLARAPGNDPGAQCRRSDHVARPRHHRHRVAGLRRPEGPVARLRSGLVEAAVVPTGTAHP